LLRCITLKCLKKNLFIVEKAERQIQQEKADKGLKYAIEFHSLLLSSNSCCVFADKQQMFQRLAAMEASIQNSNNAPVQPIMQQSAQSGNQFSVNNQQVQAFAGQQHFILGQHQSAMNQIMRSNRPANKNKLLAWISQSNNFLAQTNAYIAYNVEEEADE